jgi:AcrR family transcriptional regulator
MSQRMHDRILAGAAELFTRTGFSKVRMEEIADHLGISKKTIYNHFENKETLFDETLLASVSRIIGELEEITVDPDLSFSEKLNRTLEKTYREIGMKDTAFFKDLGRYHEGLASRPIVVLREKTLAVISSLILEAEEEGLVALSVPRERLARVFQNIVEGVTSRQSDEESVSRVQILKDSVKVTLEGVLTPQGRELLIDSVLKREQP